ncbi:hypothetical protein HIM_06334 [Hirsutella minnesotensis 3608]|uniref:37S ribosomal protein S35, mitochondrial n=1 Tax=Hirsutella minnesotensis 3608 TaxID=1043627 RepID=A0A0F7ZU66_9HYPO|nr:hypothetical protein HIM_06334 [Hirsutella minnesotensis 3608]
MPLRLRAFSVSLATDAVLQQQQRQWGCAALGARALSTTPRLEKMSRARQRMFDWMKSREGVELARSSGRGPRYLGPMEDQPFPLNPLFRSQPVLDDQTKEIIWEKVIKNGEALKAVSAEMSIDVRRIAAVVRLKEMQRQWERDGIRLATPYAKAVMGMLPKTSWREGEDNPPHEAINEVHVHKWSMRQLFVPVSESRHFTRADAAKAFHDKLLPVDARSPMPQLIDMEKRVQRGASKEESMKKFKRATQKEEETLARRIEQERAEEARKTTRHFTGRYEFRFKEISVDDVGKEGRSAKGTGWRYGAPLQDRKRGMVKIPTSVP